MPIKKPKTKPQQLPLDMERAIRDYTNNKNKVKEKVFEGEKPLKTKKKIKNKKNIKSGY